MQEKLSLDKDRIATARQLAASIVDGVYREIAKYSTESIERTILRLLGVDGVDDVGVPLPNVVVKHVKDEGALAHGVSRFFANVMANRGIGPREAGELIGAGRLTAEDAVENGRWRECLERHTGDGLRKIIENTRIREETIDRFGAEETPYLYSIVATGNIYEDAVQAKAAACQGAQIIAVIRSTAQSLLDFVPYGATTEGFGGTFATQENFRIMRAALDEAGEESGRYIRLVNYCSGLCMPEIAAMGAMERLDIMLNDALYGIIFRDINMLRTFVDQHFSRRINAYAGIIITTGEDNYLTTADAFEEAHTVLASQFINEQFAVRAGLPPSLVGLGHAFEMDPTLENGFLFEVAQAQMSREIFPHSPIKYMPPTKFMTGDIFTGNVQDALFMAASILTGQTIHLLGVLTEAIHTPHMHDRYLSIKNACYVRRNMKSIFDEVTFREGGIIQRRAQEVLERGIGLLEAIRTAGLFTALEQGVFANIKRPIDGGKGREGVFEKSPGYFNPFDELLEAREVRG